MCQPDADFFNLPDDPRDEHLYASVNALYDEYHGRPGLKAAKVTKLLHTKRPTLVPIVDSVVAKAYKTTANKVASDLGASKSMFWAAIWRDARHNADGLGSVRDDLRGMGGTEALVADLPLLRLQDILAWSRSS